MWNDSECWLCIFWLFILFLIIFVCIGGTLCWNLQMKVGQRAACRKSWIFFYHHVGIREIQFRSSGLVASASTGRASSLSEVDNFKDISILQTPNLEILLCPSWKYLSLSLSCCHGFDSRKLLGGGSVDGQLFSSGTHSFFLEKSCLPKLLAKHRTEEDRQAEGNTTGFAFNSPDLNLPFNLPF